MAVVWVREGEQIACVSVFAVFAMLYCFCYYICGPP